MPNSYVLHTANGSQTVFSFAAIDDYLSPAYLKVYVNDVLQTSGVTLNVSTENATFATAPLITKTIRIQRETPGTVAGYTANIADFVDGSVLTAAALDQGLKGLLHLVQESNDTGSGALGKTTDQLGWDAKTLPVKNAGTALDAGDLVTKAQLDAVSLFGASTIPQAWSFTGTGSLTTFALSPLPSSTAAEMFIVEVGGVIQRPSTDYSLTTTDIVFASAPGNALGIQVRNFGVARNALDVILNSSITTGYLADGAVTELKLGSASVSAAKMAANAIATASIQDDAVTAAKMADNSVAVEHIQTNAVGALELQTDSVITAKIQNLAVTSDKLASGAVNNAALGSLSVTMDKMKTSAAGFTSAGTERLLHVSTAGTLSLKDLANIGFGGAIAANLDFANTFKNINLPIGTASGQAITWQQVEEPDNSNVYKILTSNSLDKWIVFGDCNEAVTSINLSTAGQFVKLGTALVSAAGTWKGIVIQPINPGSVNQTVVSFETLTPSTGFTPNVNLVSNAVFAFIRIS
jgi:hypothetical protein